MPKATKSETTQSSRSWLFTYNNPTSAVEFDKIKNVRYGVYQKERGESGTEHYQGYVEFKLTQRMSALKKWLPTAHFEIRRGNREQARDYCMKEDTRIEPPVEYGTFELKPGERTDLSALKETIDQGSTLEQIWDQHPNEFLKYNRGIMTALTLKQKKRDFKTRVRIICGPTGTGKTKWVFDNYPVEDVYMKQRSNWWDGYTGQKVVLIDDFYGWLPLDEMLRICDRYPMMVQTKGGNVQFTSELVVITSNAFPWQWYKEDLNVRLAPLYRRVDEYAFKYQLDEVEASFTNVDEFRAHVNKFVYQ